MDSFQTAEYKRSRNSYSLFCMLEYFIAITVSDAYLSKLLLSLGFSDAQIGVILAIVSVSFLFGLSAVLFAGRIRFMRRYIILNNMVSLVLFSALYLTPFLHLSENIRLPAVVGCILFAYYCRYSVEAMTSRWGNSYVSPDHRGDFSASKVNLSLAGGIVFSLAMGFMVDYFEGKGRLNIAFLLIAVIGMVFNFGSFLCLKHISPLHFDTANNEEVIPFKIMMKTLFSIPAYRQTVVLHSLYNIGLYLSISFLATYKLNELAYSVGTVQIINVSGQFSRFLFSHAFGKYSDRRSYAKGITLGLIFFAVALTVNIFTTPSVRFLIIVYTLLYNIALCGTGQNMENMLYSYVPMRYYVQASAVKSAIAGVIGFLATLGGSALLSHIQANGNRFLGLFVYGQQVISAIALVFALLAILFSVCVMEKQTNMHQ